MIADEDISIVVQGPIIYKSAFEITDQVTQLVCQRLRKIFPKSEIILSTWEGESVKGIIYDKIIFNKDPGATWFNYDNYDLLNNCNRLIVSTLAGIKAATKKYVLKLRSDLFISSKNFLTYFEKYPLYNTEYKFVKSRIICFSLNTLHGHRNCLFTMHRPYHISDWGYFGLKDDLLNLYDIPLVQEPEFSQWFLTRCKPFHDIEPGRLWKMPPEQYITSSFLNKFFPISLQHTADTSNNNISLSSKLITNNFLILDQSQFCLISLKYLYFPFSSTHGNEWYFFHSDWLKNYSQLIQMSKILKIQIRIKSIYRGFIGILLIKTLRFMNLKTHAIFRLVAFIIKKNR